MDVPVAQQILPRRQAAKQASANITQQLDDSDSDTHHAQSSPSPKRVIQYGRKAMRRRMGREPETIAVPSSLGHDSQNLSNTPPFFDQNGTTVPLHDGRPKKRPFSQDSTEDALDSPLTPVSDSDPLSTSLTPPPTSPFPPSLTSRQFPLADQTEGRTDNYRSTRNKRKRQGMVSRPKKWKKKELGEIVWVLIDDHSRIFDHGKAAQEREHVWWPAKIRTGPPGGGKHLTVFLYGQTASKVKDIQVSYPTEDNILPFNDSTGEAKFREPTFVTPSHHNLSNVMSPRKKAKRDRSELVNLWNAAVHELNVERAGREAVPSGTRPERGLDPGVRLGTSDDDENLPAVGGIDWKASLASIPTSSPTSSSPTKRNRGSKKGREATPISEDDSDFGIGWLEEDVLDQENWSPAPADETLLIPGELVLARGTDGDKSYWPAMVLEYLPQKSKREKEGKYKIEYLDNTITFVRRSAFFTPEEDEFATCQLGQFESSYDDAANDSDAEDLLDPRSQNQNPSPTPAYPPPSKETFLRLDVRSQFVFTKPILVAILNEQYPPARERHDKFLKGGQARKSVVNSAGLRGEMEPRSIVELQRWLCEWCLRDERLAMDSAVVNKDEELKNAEIGEIEASSLGQSEMMVASGTNEDVMKSEAGTQPLPSAITDTTSIPAEERPDSLSADSCMENTKPMDQSSPLSSLSDAPQETTPMSLENNIPEPTTDAMDAMSDLTESENLDTHVLERSTQPPRQYGCPAFEVLTKMEKLDYCLNVLLPEAVIQILLWRKGLRTVMEVLSPVEEQQLHDEGAKLLEETDWVYDIVRLRHAHERRLAKRSKEDGVSSSQKSDRGRLRSVGRVNYLE